MMNTAKILCICYATIPNESKKHKNIIILRKNAPIISEKD